MPGSGNHEVIEDENNSIQQEATATSTEEKKEIPFKKPVMLQEHMKTTSIKEVLEKHQSEVPAKVNSITEETKTPQVTQEEDILQENAVKETPLIEPVEEISEIQPNENDKEISEVIFVSLQQCWEEAIKEAATENTMIAEGLLLKQIPVATDDNIIEIEVPNEVAKQEIRQILPTLTQCLLEKTGIPYSIEVKVVKVEQEKQVDKSNPDEKFKHLCQENPKLLEFKQRLNLSIS